MKIRKRKRRCMPVRVVAIFRGDLDEWSLAPNYDNRLLAEMSQPVTYYEGPLYSGQLGVIKGALITYQHKS